jgi:DNA mismatch repair protein MutL
VNRRPFKDKSLQQAMLRAYTSYIPERRFPGAIIFLDMDPEDVDVNIHPTKSEVRFREPDVVFKRLYGVVRSKLVDSAQLLDAAPHEQVAVYKTSGLAKTVPMNRQYGGVYENKPDPFGAGTSNRGRPSNPSPAFSPPQTRDGDLPDALQPRFPASAPSTHGDASSETKSLEGQFDPTSSSGSSQPPGSFQSPRSPQTFGSSQEPVSDQTHELASHGTTQEPYFSIDAAPKAYQLLNRFILLEHDDHIELMDQHAIHERVLVNQLAHEDHEKRYTCQTLLVPSILDLPENLGHFSDDISADFDNMGFRLEVDEQNGKVTVHGFPDFLSLERGLKVLEEILEDLSQGLPPDRDALRRDILHRTACRAAIKAGDVLSQDELNGLVAATLTMDSTQSTCPHGRSAIWKISIAEANAMFDRT